MTLSYVTADTHTQARGRQGPSAREVAQRPAGTQRPAGAHRLAVALGRPRAPLRSRVLPWHQTSARLSSSYLVLYTLVSEHENKMTFYHKV